MSPGVVRDLMDVDDDNQLLFLHYLHIPLTRDIYSSKQSRFHWNKQAKGRVTENHGPNLRSCDNWKCFHINYILIPTNHADWPAKIYLSFVSPCERLWRQQVHLRIKTAQSRLSCVNPCSFWTRRENTHKFLWEYVLMSRSFLRWDKVS